MIIAIVAEIITLTTFIIGTIMIVIIIVILITLQMIIVMDAFGSRCKRRLWIQLGKDSGKALVYLGFRV